MSPTVLPHDSDRHPLPVVIIGGGIAGLATAEAILRQCGLPIRVTILEAKRTTGGRAGSFEDPSSGEWIDYCQHVAMGCCQELLGLMDRCELLDYWQRHQELRFHHPDFPTSYFRESRWLPAPFHLLSSLATLAYLSRAQKHQIFRGLWRLMRTPSSLLADQTAGQWLRRAGQSEETIEAFWNVILVSALGERTEVVSMAAARKVFVDGFAASRGASDLWVPRVPLSELFGDKLFEAVESLGAKIRCGVLVRRVVPFVPHAPSQELGDAGDSSHLRAVVELTSGEKIPAAAVISAVPWHRLPALLDAPPAHDQAMSSACASLPAIGQIPASPISGIHCWFDRPWMDEPHAVMVGTKVQWIFRDPLNSDPKKHEHASRTSQEHYYQWIISASSDAPSKIGDSFMEELLAEVHSVFPLSREAKLLRYRVVTDPKSVFSPRPDIETLRPSASTAMPGFHLAGDWTNTGWPATMEGAVISGRRAAASLFREWGISESRYKEHLAKLEKELTPKRNFLSRLMIRS